MTLYAYPDPEAAVLACLTANAALFPTGTTFSTSFPTELTHHHIQFAWDGTPTEDEQREVTAIRVTYWTPRGHRSEAKDGATIARAVLLAYADDDLWRITKGAGRTPGTDPDTELPFVTFTVNAETRPAAVA